MSGQVRDFYDTEAADKYRTMMQSEDELKFYRADIIEISRLCISGLPVLDVGCGTGDLLKLLDEAKPGLSLLGIDAAETMLRHAKTLLPTAKFIIGDAVKLPFDLNSIGALMCTFVTHHLTDIDMRAAVAEFARVLAPGGVLYHCYWHGDGLMDPFSKKENPPPLIKRREKTVDAIFAEFGFSKRAGRLDSYGWGDMAFAIYQNA